MITRQQIEQYTSLKREIVMLEDQIYAAEGAGDYAVDMVRGSTKEIPYAMHNIVIKGYTTQHIPRLIKRKTALEAVCVAVERFIEGVPDSVTRQILVRRYIEGRQLAQTAKLVGYSVSQTKRLINRCFEKMNPDGP